MQFRHPKHDVFIPDNTDPWTALRRVTHLGSAKGGAAHWYAQRVSAVELVLLGLWLMSITKPVQSQVPQREPGFLPAAPPSSSAR